MLGIGFQDDGTPILVFSKHAIEAIKKGTTDKDFGKILVAIGEELQTDEE